MDLALVSGSRRQGATSNFRETEFSKVGTDALSLRATFREEDQSGLGSIAAVK